MSGHFEPLPTPPRGEFPFIDEWPVMTEADVMRFQSRVDQSEGPDGCHLWIAGKDGDGYGAFWYGGRQFKAHRVALFMEQGPLPRLVVDHLCKTRACVNPRHLELVTVGENVRRGESPSAEAARMEVCSNGHQFDATRADGKYRRCRECGREYSRRAKEKARAGAVSPSAAHVAAINTTRRGSPARTARGAT